MGVSRRVRVIRRRCSGAVIGSVLASSSLVALAPAPVAAQAEASTAVSVTPAAPDPRVGLRPGRWDAGEAAWNLRLLSTTRPSERFLDGVNSDLSFTGHYAIQGSFAGFQVWDISDPARPWLAAAYHCPASQSDVSVYRNLLFVSGEGLEGRLDCGAQGVEEPSSAARLRGLRIFDISDVRNPRYVGNVQTCRGSHTHSVLADPRDPENVYVYISGSAPVRPATELEGCTDAPPEQDPNSALFRIEVIRVPLAHPERAAIVSSPRIFENLAAPPRHGEAGEEAVAAARQAAEARARGEFTAVLFGVEQVAPHQWVDVQLDSIVKARGGSGSPTAADSATLRREIQGIVDRMVASQPRSGPTQCHDITVFPAIGLAGGACEGYGLLLDIRDPAHPTRLAAVADSAFSYWHSATFNADGTKVVFTDEWGGGMQPKCRTDDPREWGANAIFTLTPDRRLQFQGYYKLPAVQTPLENCVAHNGSIVPIPGRDVMVQAWYQGGVSVFDFTDPANPKEIAFFDRGPVDPTRLRLGGSWSAYWYNGAIYSSEITRGLDVLELVPGPLLSRNEIDAARSVKLEYLNVQGQPRYTWPATFSLARAYLDQLERSNGLPPARVSAVRGELAAAERLSGAARGRALTTLAARLDAEAARSSDAAKVRALAGSVRDLASASR